MIERTRLPTVVAIQVVLTAASAGGAVAAGRVPEELARHIATTGIEGGLAVHMYRLFAGTIGKRNTERPPLHRLSWWGERTWERVKNTAGG